MPCFNVYQNLIIFFNNLSLLLQNLFCFSFNRRTSFNFQNCTLLFFFSQPIFQNFCLLVLFYQLSFPKLFFFIEILFLNLFQNLYLIFSNLFFFFPTLIFFFFFFQSTFLSYQNFIQLFLLSKRCCLNSFSSTTLFQNLNNFYLYYFFSQPIFQNFQSVVVFQIFFI